MFSIQIVTDKCYECNLGMLSADVNLCMRHSVRTLLMNVHYLKYNHSLIKFHTPTHTHIVLTKILYTIGLGMQAPTAEMPVVLEVPSEVNEGMCMYN